MEQQYNKLTPAEAERLFLIMEECGEIVQVIGKILRHGYEEHHPDNQEESNRMLLEKELGDLSAVVEMAIKAKDLNPETSTQCEIAKTQRIGKYLHHQNKEPKLFEIGEEVLVYDRYRFAIPLRAKVKNFSNSNDGIEVILLQSNNTSYPIGAPVWVHQTQLKKAE